MAYVLKNIAFFFFSQLLILTEFFMLYKTVHKVYPKAKKTESTFRPVEVSTESYGDL